MESDRPLPSKTPSPPKRRRWLKRLLLALGVVLGVPVLLVGVLLGVLQTEVGSRVIRTQALTILQSAFAGELTFEHVELRGGRVVLLDATLKTPEGELVAKVGRLEAQLRIPALLTQTISLEHVTLSDPELHLVQEDQGLNLMRALAPRVPKPEEPETVSSPLSWVVAIDAVTLERGRFDFTLPDRTIALESLKVNGKANIHLSPLELDGALSLSSTLTQPLRERLTLEAQASSTRGVQRYGFDLRLGETLAKGTLELPTFSLTLEELVAHPTELSAVLPSWPVKVPIYAKGLAGMDRSSLEVRAGKAQLLVSGAYDLTAFSAPKLSVKATGVDLRELLGAELNSSIALEAKGSLDDFRPATATGTLRLEGTWDAKGARLAEVRLEAKASNGSVTLAPLEVTSPGVRVVATGAASMERLALQASIQANDLSKLGPTLQRFARIDVGTLGGQGLVTAVVSGPLERISAKAVGHLSQLEIATIRATALTLDVDIPDVLRPLETDTLVSAKTLALGERQLEDVVLDFYSAGRSLDLDLSTKGLGDLKLHTIGRIADDAQGARLDSLELTWTGSRWALLAPMHVAWGRGLSLTPFSLSDGHAHIDGKLELRGSKLDAEALIEGLELSKLPTAAVPKEWKLGGTITRAFATVSGRTNRPEVRAELQLDDVAAFGVTEVDATVSGSWSAQQRAVGQLSVSSKLGRAQGTFDVPVIALLEQQPGAASARFTISDVDTQTLESQLGVSLPVVTRASARLELSGDARAPQLSVVVEAPRLSLKRDASEAPPMLEATGVVLTAKTDQAGLLGASVQLEAFGGTHRIELSTKLTLASLRTQAFTQQALLSLPAELTVALEAVQLKAIAPLLELDESELGGALTVTGTLHGPFSAPTGALTLAALDATFPPLQHLDGEVAARFEPQRVQLTGHVSAKRRPALELTASLGTGLAMPVRVLLAPSPAEPEADDDATTKALLDALARVPLELQLGLRPFPLADAIAHADGQTVPNGQISAALEVLGTLEQPTVQLRGTATDLRFDKYALGAARFDVKATSAEQKLEVVLGSQGRDDFTLLGTLGFPLRLSALRDELKWKEVPVDARLDAKQFELAFLSGVTDSVRTVGGVLDFAGTVKGTLGAPKLVGDATLSRGAVTLASFGEYRDIELKLHATNDVLELSKLEVRSGGGTGSITAKAEKQSSGAYALVSKAELKKFPVVVDDQLMATVSLRYDLEGEATSKLINLKRLSLPRVDVDLPDIKRKDLQSLDRPTDVIVLRDGMTLTKKRQQEAREASKPKGEGLAIRVIVDAPRNVWVRSSEDINVEAGLSDGFRIDVDDSVRLSGEARVVRGRIAVIGRAFEVGTNSSVRFNGAPTEPYINASAIHWNEREQVKITISVAGKLPDIAIKPTSEPPMSESDIYAVLVTGRRNLQAGGGAAVTPGAAASVVGQLAASELKKAVGKALPLDVLNFETTDGFDRLRFEVGKYLSDTVYLGTNVNVGAKRDRGENTATVRLEWQMTRAVGLEVYAGDALSFGADAVWTRDF